MGVAQGAFYANGHRVAGCNLTINNGMFIDTENVIVAKTSYTPSTFSYTATEDCALYIEIPAKGGYSTFLLIDGKEVQGVNLAGSGTNYLIATVLLKEGQTATLSSSSFPSVTPDYAVYGIQEGAVNGPKVTTYHGVPVTANIYDDGYCNLTKVEFEDFILYNLDFTVHIKGTSTGVEFLPFYTFDSGVLDDIDWRSMLTYCVYNDTYFARVRTKKEVNALGGYYGNFTISDGWYSCTPTTFLVQKNQPSS